MSMTMLTIMQIAGIFALYSLVTIALPALIFHKKVADKRPLEQFMVYFVIGNFFIMHIVFLLQLLHISNRITLILFTVIPGLIVYIRNYDGNMADHILRWLQVLHKAVFGIMGRKTFTKKLIRAAVAGLKRLIRKFAGFVRHNLFESLAFVLLFVCLLWVYGDNYVSYYGYSFSDLPVHNYWINAMCDGDIYVAGVYPFGFHCIIYYFYEVFGIDTYVLLRVFGFTQMIYIFFMLLAFIKGICKSRYAAYAGCLVYAGYDIFNLECTRRYLGTLPQEFGMVFILPAIYFAIRFFETRKKELALPEKIKGMSDSSWYLTGYALSFGMTIAVHFYDTMIAGIFCVAIAIGFIFRFFNIKYLGRILVAVIAAVMIGVLPMGVAFATGTPLQGSLNWGMNVMQGKGSGDSTTSADVNSQSEEKKTVQDEKQTKAAPDGSIGQADSASTQSTQQAAGSKSGSSTQNKKLSLSKKLYGAYNSIKAGLKLNVLRFDMEFFLPALLGVVAFTAVMGLLMFVLKQTDYGAILISVAVMTLCMLVLVSAKMLGLPELMDANRSRIYFAYLLTVIACVAVDALCSVWFLITKKEWIMNLLSLAAVVGVVIFGFQMNLIRRPFSTGRLETNGAITCLTNIIKDNEDNTWTIVSANDELRMIYGHGYHYEPITFIHLNESKRDNKSIYIDTKYVYFYIEKRPIDYLHPYEGSGQMVSLAGAGKDTPIGSGISVYFGENRWIVMSKMYYWAQKFMKLYPNEMKVYYEDDEFVCYRLEQNMYSLFNLAID